MVLEFHSVSGRVLEEQKNIDNLQLFCSKSLKIEMHIQFPLAVFLIKCNDFRPIKHENR